MMSRHGKRAYPPVKEVEGSTMKMSLKVKQHEVRIGIIPLGNGVNYLAHMLETSAGTVILA